MDIDPKRISQGDGSKQQMPKTWGGHLLSWGKSTRKGGWGKKNYLYEALLNIILMEREAATRSVQRSYKLWRDPSLVIIDEAVPELSFLELLFFRALKFQHVCMGWSSLLQNQQLWLTSESLVRILWRFQNSVLFTSLPVWDGCPNAGAAVCSRNPLSNLAT
jgi:hypothetical protein